MKTIHPKNVSDEQLIDSMIANLRRTPSIDVSIIKDELMRRLSSVQQSAQPDVCHAQEMLTVYTDAELRDFVGYKWLFEKLLEMLK